MNRKIIAIITVLLLAFSLASCNTSGKKATAPATEAVSLFFEPPSSEVDKIIKQSMSEIYGIVSSNGSLEVVEYDINDDGNTDYFVRLDSPSFMQGSATEAYMLVASKNGKSFESSYFLHLNGDEIIIYPEKTRGFFNIGFPESPDLTFKFDGVRYGLDVVAKV